MRIHSIFGYNNFSGNLGVLKKAFALAKPSAEWMHIIYEDKDKKFLSKAIISLLVVVDKVGYSSNGSAVNRMILKTDLRKIE